MVLADRDGLSRASLRRSKLTAHLNQAGLTTLLVDLLTEGERKRRPSPERDLPLLARRLEEVTSRASAEPETRALPIGYLAASTGAAAALRAAVAVGDAVHSVVSLVCENGFDPDGSASLTDVWLLRWRAFSRLPSGRARKPLPN